jgi:archaellum component FlaF (FlaF/FlaG flagellin family)
MKLLRKKMKDDILKSYLNSFTENYELKELKEDEAFEHFVNFNIVSKLYPREINLDNLSTGGSDDIGLDGAAIIVNGNIINTEEEIDYFLEQNGTLTITFALIQSKNSSNFKGDQIGNFIFGIKSLFDDKASIPENDNIRNLRKIKEKIYKHSIDFEQNPELKLFFVTTGEWKEPEAITGRVNKELKELDKRNLFRAKVKINFFDAERLKNTYREISRKIVKEIKFNNHISLPDIPDNLKVRQSYIGSIPVKDYLELITNNDNQLAKGLFYDNVRDYQGENKVNKEITETLRSHSNQALLSIMNNGITIIAKKVEPIGSKMKLTDFQIVNGCQSSHVLFENKIFLNDNTHIVLKIIETIDSNITNKIIRATNRQTEVKDEAFESLKSYHKNLQEFYTAKSKLNTMPLFYERRSKEYVNRPDIKPTQIITLSYQIKSYVATHLNQPHSIHRYFGEILESYKAKLFNGKDDYWSYYLSSVIINKLDRILKKHTYSKYKIYKYQIALIIYKMTIVMKNKNKIDDMITVINDTAQLKPILLNAIDIIEAINEQVDYSKNDAIRSKDYTKKISEKLQEWKINFEQDTTKQSSQ